MLYLAPNEATIHQLLKDADHLQLKSISTMTFDDMLKTVTTKDFSARIVPELLPLYESDVLFPWTEAALEEWYEDVAVLLKRYEPIPSLESLYQRVLAILVWTGETRTFSIRTNHTDDPK